MFVKKGRYGGTFAHKDIAFEFASAISPVFKLYLIREFQRLKTQENDLRKIEWDAKRFLSKNNYLIQTDAVKNYLKVIRCVTISHRLVGFFVRAYVTMVEEDTLWRMICRVRWNQERARTEVQNDM